MHRDYDEAWYIIEGRMEFQLGDDAHLCPAGSMVIAPRGTAHTFHNPGPDPARMLAILTPQALQLIEELGRLTTDGPPNPTALRSLLARHETFTVDDR